MRRRSLLLCSLPLILIVACGDDETQGGTKDVTNATDSVLVPDTERPDVDRDSDPPLDTTTDTGQPDTGPPKPGEFGYACDENLDCNSGWCVQTADGRQCTRTCIDSCPSGYDCRLAPGTDATFICLPRFVNLCAPCRETGECNEGGGAGNYCLSDGENGKFCGASCSADPDCPDGYECKNAPVGGGAEASQCVPKEGAECKCSPYAKQAQRATTCFIENENGKCEGTRFCLQSGLSTCDAKTPFPESCNKLDDNCNTQVDEFQPDYVCEIKNDFGKCKGTGTCVDGQETCVGTAPAPEVCDLIDNDCDSNTDNVTTCDDLNPCTKDSCNPENGECIHANDDTKLCDDGNVCTQVDKCTAGVCTGYNPTTCGDGNPCKTWSCDPVVGCLSSFNSNPCEDGNPCTVNDTCNLGACVSGGPNACNDNNECTTDSCTANVGCKHDPLVNGTGCQMAGLGDCAVGQCQNGGCVSKPTREGLSCNYGSAIPACRESRCQAGACRLANVPAGTVCGNADACPPCVDLIGSIFDCCFGLFEVEVSKRCDTSGNCSIVDTPNAQCQSASCGSCAGVCIPACGIGLCLQ